MCTTDGCDGDECDDRGAAIVPCPNVADDLPAAAAAYEKCAGSANVGDVWWLASNSSSSSAMCGSGDVCDWHSVDADCCGLVALALALAAVLP